MKKNTHPSYQEVLFVDSSTGNRWVCRSAIPPKNLQEAQTFEGKEYPVCLLSVSSASHPLFTGKTGFVDAEGRVDKFNKRYAQKKA